MLAAVESGPPTSGPNLDPCPIFELRPGHLPGAEGIEDHLSPWRARSPGMEFQAALNWDNIARFKSKHAVKLILKGIATAEDADQAVRNLRTR